MNYPSVNLRQTAKFILVPRGYRKKIRRIKARYYEVNIYSFPWDCFKVREIGDDVYELYQADCNDPEARRRSRTTVTINVKKKGIYNVLLFPEKMIIKLWKEYHNYNVSRQIFLPKNVQDLQFDDDNLILKYMYPQGRKVGTARIKLPKPILYERSRVDHYSIIKLWKPEDYQLLKEEVLKKVEVDAN
ncbi:hypothetical protein AVU39_gp61 [Sulfolobus monocaudavirus SMV2]|uniref:hypothetical protein n=1 Tax=Sulfolobus monocaudavirus SMV2 TaxID=1580591 RepID=UPI0006D316BF|nr:hypothetical protein AVU39_gp61 [Sulfolobus monocaudavirus SMV2]AIZ11395.1 hypothetical protein [Sulfolobus monocaudavirus SMV2]